MTANQGSDTKKTSQLTVKISRGRLCAQCPAHLVVPAQEAQAAGGRLRRVEAGSAPGVVVVDPGRLRDAVEQLAFGGGGAEVQVLAHRLRFPTGKKQGVVI